MPKILIISILPLPALLDQAWGSALIPSDQQKYSENPIIPQMEIFGCQFPSRLIGFISFNGPNRSRLKQPLGAREQGGFSREKDRYW